MDLIHQAEVDLREALAERLSVMDSVPPEIIIFLANDDISVARPVLQRSRVLNDVDLIYIITARNNRYWQSIAQREHLSPIVADRLIDTEDTKTVLNLADNKHIVLKKSSIRKLIKFSLKAVEVQASLLRRPEIDGELATDLYVCASQSLCSEINKRFRMLPSAIASSLEGLIGELSVEAKGLSLNVTVEMRALAARFGERGEISPVTMINALRRGQLSFFIALFAERLELPPEAVIRLIRKEDGRNFATACHSVGMMKSEFASIFLLSRGVRTDEKIVDPGELVAMLRFYDTIRKFDAQRVVNSWVKNPEIV
jgi:uncharacterized protein (DUF2336 family)